MKLTPQYTPQDFEENIYKLWEQSGAFVPKKASAKSSFSMTLPPPNANANLHIGHALDFQIKDTIARYQRLQGKNVLMLPGADHAGFETWVVYEKYLNSKGESRFDYSREQLYQQVLDFVSDNRTSMENQVRRLGISCDWTKNTFTLDDKVVSRAYSTFKTLWEQNLIYRGKRLVNYCTFHGTSFSDIEVTHQEKAGNLWSLDYPLTDGTGVITVATTRPETMLGDVAVAVHPEDPRYIPYHGKTLTLPLVGREIPVITDDMVDLEFGTGAVKITPAHDFNDYEVAQRHSLPMVEVIDHEGKLTHEMPTEFVGLSVDEAREAVLASLDKIGALAGQEDHINKVGHCYKCGTVIEPLLREQWFVSMKPLAEIAKKHLDKDQIEFFPASKQAEIVAYLDHIKDWNISRQIAWGIPIPVFQNLENPDDWIFDERVHEETITIGAHTYRRDPDVFDTWWSSGQWPYATLDYPSELSDQFYPTSLMETGVDLLKQWVSRMIMLGVSMTDQVPFKQVYFHGMILDEHGAKMSKSRGNVINPMEIVEEYGSDALRLGVINGTSAGSNQAFGIPKVIGGRNFCNKLWNIARYVEGVVGLNASSNNSTPLSDADHWINSRQNAVSSEVKELMNEYRLGEAYDRIYHYVRDDLADWYIEASKDQLNVGLLLARLEDALKMVHPFAPFVTESIWQTLRPADLNELLISASWPGEAVFNKSQVQKFNEVKAIISETRYIIKALGVVKPSMYYNSAPLLKDNHKIISSMAKVRAVTEVDEGAGMNLTSTQHKVWLDIDRGTAAVYVEKLEQDLEGQVLLIRRLKDRLSNTSYVANAPKEVVAETEVQLAEAESFLTNLEVEIAQFKANFRT